MHCFHIFDIKLSCSAALAHCPPKSIVMKGLQHHFKHVGQRSPVLSLSSKGTTRCLSSRSLDTFQQQPDPKTLCITPESRKISTLAITRQGCQRLSNGRSTAFQSGHQNLQRRLSYSTVTSTPTEPIIHSIFENTTGTWQYLIADPSTLSAAIIDTVLDYDPVTQVISTRTADSLLATALEKGYKIDRILETHAHADHLTAAFYLQKQVTRLQGHTPPTCIGKRIKQVQKMFGEKYGILAEEYNGVFDRFLDDDETFSLGDLQVTAMHLPGHTPDHLGYKIGGKNFRMHLLEYAHNQFQITYSVEIRSSMQTLAALAAISQAAVPTTYSVLVEDCSPCPAT